VRVSRYRHSVLFDALLDNAVRDGEHLVHKSRKVIKLARTILRGIGAAIWLWGHSRST
jgi:hypothetical protein